MPEITVPTIRRAFMWPGLCRSLLVLPAIGLLSVQATAQDAFDGSGGDPFRLHCPSGHYAVGLDGRVGAWIDQLGLVCAPWLAAEQRFGAPIDLEAVGDSTGGDPQRVLCPDGWAIAGDYSISYARKPRVMHSMRFACRPAAARSTESVTRSFGSSSEIDRTLELGGTLLLTGGGRCPEHELAAGFHGRSGLYVDDIELTCAPAPYRMASAAQSDPGRGTVHQAPAPPAATTAPGHGQAATAKTICKPDYVARLAGPDDQVCVPPESRNRVKAENASARSRIDPKGACKAGYVSRQAFEGDRVCVTPETHASVQEENQRGPGRTMVVADASAEAPAARAIFKPVEGSRVAITMSEAPAGGVAELRCRGGNLLRIEDTGLQEQTSSGQPRIVLSLAFNPSAAAAGRDGRGLQPGTCSWIDRAVRADEWRSLRFLVTENAQVKQKQHGSSVDLSPTAAERYPDSRTIPAYLSDPRHYWSFFVFDTKRGWFEATGHEAWRLGVEDTIFSDVEGLRQSGFEAKQ